MSVGLPKAPLIAILLVMLCRAAMAGKFMLAVLPDTQAEMSGNTAMFTSQMNWIAQNRAASNIAFVLHVGDIINWDPPDHSQWRTASNGFRVLDNAGIHYALALGNHDTAAVKTNGGSAAPGDTHLNVRITTNFNAFFPVSRFPAQRGRYEATKSDNAYYTFSAGGLRWLVLTLEFCARQGPVDWAKTVLANHTNYNVIILTHSHLTSSGTISTSNSGYGDLSPKQIFDQLISQYPNVRMVFSGHVTTSAWRTDPGVHGNLIYQMLQNYQNQDMGGGYIRLVEIDTTARTISAWMYSPYYNLTKNDSSRFGFSAVQFVPQGEGGAGEVPSVSVPNAGFELPRTTTFVYNPSGVSWTFQGNAGVAANRSGFTSANPLAPEGTQVAFLQRTSSVSQTLIGLLPGIPYMVTCSAAQRGRYATAGQTWNIQVDGTAVRSFFAPPSATNYVEHSAVFTARSFTHTLGFAGTDLHGGDNTVFIDDVRVIPGSVALPVPWLSADIGGVELAGGAAISQGMITVAGSGSDIGGTNDEFRFLYRVLQGGCDFRGRITTMDNMHAGAKAGIMLRNSTNANSMHAMMSLTSGLGLEFIYRNSAGGVSAVNRVPNLVPPLWLRLVRSGDSIRGFYSVNGSVWFSAGTTSVPLASSIYAGFAVSSHVEDALCSAVFDQLTIPMFRPAITGSLLTNGFRIMAAAAQGQACVLEASTDLSSWIPIGTNTASSGNGLDMVDAETEQLTRRFYRVRY